MKEKTIHTIATAHLDTVWNWDFERTVSVLLKKTLDKNFYLMKKYPNYRFNFEGAYRYELFEEYYPEKFEELKKWVSLNKWNITGTGYENGDVNIPSPESLIRNFMYGNNYFEEKFQKKCNDIFLPDCFGFGYALPSIASHCNISGFSTQKLTWGSAYGIPFNVGKWYGVDGNYIIASINPGSYYSGYLTFRNNLRAKNKFKADEKYDICDEMVYHGVGDRGGAPHEFSARTVQRETEKNDRCSTKVLSSSPTEFFDKINNDKELLKRLPVWDNELVMTVHGAGSYTARTASKRLNSKSEEILDLAEKTAVFGDILGLSEYNTKLFEKSWKRVISHQFHDDITGTSLQRVYERSWNDYALSINQASDEYRTNARLLIENIDTSMADGDVFAVHNPFYQRAKRVVVASVKTKKNSVCVRDDQGNKVDSQILSKTDDTLRFAFVADVTGLGFNVYSVCQSDEVQDKKNTDNYKIENEKFVVSLNTQGDVYSIFDKKLDVEILKEPVSFDLYFDNGNNMFPAWNIEYKDISKKKKCSPELVSIEKTVDGEILKQIRVEKSYNNSRFSMVISLEKEINVVRFDVDVDWYEKRTLLKHNFKFTAKNEKARYDLGLGSILRGNNTENLYEVPFQRWVSLTDKTTKRTSFIVSDCKHSIDKPDDNTLRLTAIHTPKGDWRKASRQSMLDFGLNRYSFGIGSLENENLAEIEREASLFSENMIVFSTDKHKGEIKPNEEFISLNNENISLRAMKKAEKTDEIIIRLNNLTDTKQENVIFDSKMFEIVSYREVYGTEEMINDEIHDGCVKTDLMPFEIKSFALRVNKKEKRLKKTKPVDLPLNLKATTTNDARENGNIPFIDCSLPAELLPKKITSGAIDFEIQKNVNENNACLCDGQRIKLDKTAKRFTFIGSSLTDDREYDFYIDGKRKTVRVQDIFENICCYDLPDLGRKEFFKSDALALELTHCHSSDKDNVAKQMYFFRYSVTLDNNSELILPKESGLLLLSAAYEFDDRKTTIQTELTDSVDENHEIKSFGKRSKISKKFDELYDKFMDGFMDSEKYPFIGNM